MLSIFREISTQEVTTVTSFITLSNISRIITLWLLDRKISLWVDNVKDFHKTRETYWHFGWSLNFKQICWIHQLHRVVLTLTWSCKCYQFCYFDDFCIKKVREISKFWKIAENEKFKRQPQSGFNVALDLVTQFFLSVTAQYWALEIGEIYQNI